MFEIYIIMLSFKQKRFRGLSNKATEHIFFKYMAFTYSTYYNDLYNESNKIQLHSLITENGEPKLAAPVGIASSAEESEPRNVSYTYTLWLGTNVTESFSLSLISPRNTSFFRAMNQAAEIDSRFGFEAREWPNGHYVHTLAGKKEEPRG